MAAKSKFDALLDPTPARSTPATRPRRREAQAEASVQYGKRRDDRYAQISGLIPADLKRRFKARLALEGEEISGKLEELISAYVDKS